jgi:hypothetical protein
MPTLYDPRGPLLSTPGAVLAARQDAPKQVVLFDNGKCHPAFGSYAFLYEALMEILRSRGIDVAPERYRSPLGYTHLHPDGEELRSLVGALAATRPSAVVLGVGDAGVSDPTVRLALALEAAGLPTVSLYTPLGIQIAEAFARSRGIALPILRVDQALEASQEEARQEAERLATPIVEAVSRNGSTPPPTAREGDGPLPEQNAEGTLDVPPDDLFDLLTRAGLGDGLPVLPPTAPAVDGLIAAVAGDPDDVVIDRMEPHGAPLTLRTLATNAVMAGCREPQLPVVLAACRAMADPAYKLGPANITTHGSGNLVLVSGPIAEAGGISSAAGCLGPGARNRSNLAVGRTLTLVATNVARALLGAGDLSTMGTPAEISYCFAEAADGPWPAAHEELGHPGGTVTVAKCEGPHNVLDQLSTTAEGLLRGFALAAASGAANNSFVPGDMFLLLNRTHAQLVAGSGWSKTDVREYVYEHARVERHKLAGRGIRPSWPDDFDTVEPAPVVRGPEHVHVVVTGGIGPQSAIALPWGYTAAVTVAAG